MHMLSTERFKKSLDKESIKCFADSRSLWEILLQLQFQTNMPNNSTPLWFPCCYNPLPMFQDFFFIHANKVDIFHTKYFKKQNIVTVKYKHFSFTH